MAAMPRWLPDAVTVTRIVMIPPFLLAAEATRTAASAGLPSASVRAGAIALVLAIGASDKLDGYLARRAGRSTRHGAILDAVADRLAQWSGVWFFTFRAEPAFTPIPYWLALSLVARETVLLAAWLRVRFAGVVSVEHEIHGRVATVLIFLVVLAATSTAPPAVVGIGAAIAAANVIYSAAMYAGRMRKSGTREPPAGARPLPPPSA